MSGPLDQLYDVLNDVWRRNHNVADGELTPGCTVVIDDVDDVALPVPDQFVEKLKKVMKLTDNGVYVDSGDAWRCMNGDGNVANTALARVIFQDFRLKFCEEDVRINRNSLVLLSSGTSHVVHRGGDDGVVLLLLLPMASSPSYVVNIHVFVYIFMLYHVQDGGDNREVSVCGAGRWAAKYCRKGDEDVVISTRSTALIASYFIPLKHENHDDDAIAGVINTAVSSNPKNSSIVYVSSDVIQGFD